MRVLQLMNGATAFPLCLIGALVAMLVAQTPTRRPRGPRPRRTSIHSKSHGKRFVIASLAHPFTTINNHPNVFFLFVFLFYQLFNYAEIFAFTRVEHQLRNSDWSFLLLI